MKLEHKIKIFEDGGLLEHEINSFIQESKAIITAITPFNNKVIVTYKLQYQEKALPENKLDGFDKFWDNYNKKSGKHRCELVWTKMSEEQKQKAIEQAKIYADSFAEDRKKYQKLPLTWLNGQHWNDEIAQPKMKNLFDPKNFM